MKENFTPVYFSLSGYDARKGHGYGKAAQKLPSKDTGPGSVRTMGYDETGIYPYVPEVEEDDDPDVFSGQIEIDKFVSMINKTRMRFDPSRRADRAAFVRNQRMDMAPMGETSLPTAMKGMVPFSSKTLYGKKGLEGAPLGTGGAGQAFNTTGPYRRIGTQYGTARAPLPITSDEDFEAFNYEDIINLDPSERSMIKQWIRMKRVLDEIEHVEAV